MTGSSLPDAERAAAARPAARDSATKSRRDSSLNGSILLLINGPGRIQLLGFGLGHDLRLRCRPAMAAASGLQRRTRLPYLRRELDPKCSGYLEHRIEARFGARRQGFVETFTTER